jgi:hypothetical protein
MHRSITTLQAAGLPIREFPQTQANCTLMGQTLFDLLTGLNLEIYISDELRQQALGTVAVENPRGFNRSLHISKETLTAERGPVYVGQTLLDMPATVIAQEYRGSICVLATFASEEASLQKHLETVVKPWLASNANWALQDRRLLLGAYEDVSDKQAQWNFADIVQTTLSGRWEPSQNPWESRRETMLDVIGKAVPFTFGPVLQISPDTRVLIDSLSGRWSYEKGQRDQRSVWWYVANAFSLVIDRIAPNRTTAGPKPKVKKEFDVFERAR